MVRHGNEDTQSCLQRGIIDDLLAGGLHEKARQRTGTRIESELEVIVGKQNLSG